MSSIFDKLQKREFYPQVLPNGETVHLRGMTRKQWRIVQPFANQEESKGYTLGCCLLNEDGKPAFQQGDDETPVDFGKRVLDALDDMPVQWVEMLVTKIVKLTLEPSDKATEAIIKN